MNVHQRIKQAREAKGMNYQQFADAVGVSRGAVQQWEKGDTAPTRKNQPLVAKFLGITKEELMFDGEMLPATASAAQSTALAATDSAENQLLATVQQAQAAINGVAQLDAILSGLSAYLSQVDASKRAAVAGVMTALIHDPDDAGMRAALASMLSPAAFVEQVQKRA